MAVPFILLATQRTGSSWVQEMLGSHPDVTVYTELFLADATGFPIWEPTDVEFANTFLESRVKPPAAVTRAYWTIRYLRRIFDHSDVNAVGFKYMYDQIRRSPAVLPYAALRRVKVVHLIRRNLLDTVISLKLAAASGLFHLAADGRQAVPWWPSERVETTVRLEIPELLGQLRKLARERRAVRAWLAATRTPTYEVGYESVAGDPAAFGPVLAFLGLPPADAPRLQSGLQKLRIRPQAEVVENYPDVQEALSGTDYEPFLAS